MPISSLDMTVLWRIKFLSWPILIMIIVSSPCYWQGRGGESGLPLVSQPIVDQLRIVGRIIQGSSTDIQEPCWIRLEEMLDDTKTCLLYASVHTCTTQLAQGKIVELYLPFFIVRLFSKGPMVSGPNSEG